MRGSASTLEAKLVAFKSRTSDAPSAVAKEAKTIADAAGIKDDRRILVDEDEGKGEDV